MKVDVGERSHARGEVCAALDDLAVHALARRVEDTRNVDDVAELQAREIGGADGRPELDLVHPYVVQSGNARHFNGSRETGTFGGWPETRCAPAPFRQSLFIPPTSREPGTFGGWPETGATRRHSIPSRR